MPTIHGIEMLPVDSSQIAAIGHDTAGNTLAIQFKGRNGPGSVYHYQNVDAAAFEQFAAAESIGSHFYKHIKPHADKYPYQKMEAVPAPQEPEEQPA
jgi:hypothetical protein